jgi:hypothetical protein
MAVDPNSSKNSSSGKNTNGDKSEAPQTPDGKNPNGHRHGEWPQVISGIIIILGAIAALNFEGIGRNLGLLFGFESQVSAPAPPQPFDPSRVEPDGRAIVLRARAEQVKAADAAKRATEVSLEADQVAQSARPNGRAGEATRLEDKSLPDKTFTYEGVLDSSGGLNGIGVTTVATPQGKQSFSGNHKNSAPEGYGILILNSVERYEGQFSGGKMQGYGILTLSDRSRYEGAFLQDRPNGFGVLKDARGQLIYEGEFRQGDKHGVGVTWQDSGAKPVVQNWVNGTPAP